MLHLKSLIQKKERD